MSDHVTWEPCLRCGLPAAVGWVSVDGVDGAPARVRPIEFDCSSGCPVGLDELLLAYAALDRPPQG